MHHSIARASRSSIHAALTAGLSSYLERLLARPACQRAAAINYSILPDGSPRG